MAEHAEASPSTRSGFNLVYSSEMHVGNTVEVTESSKPGRKRQRNPAAWKMKHVKKPGLRKNSPRVQISELTDCCKKKCLQQFSTSHLAKIRSDFEEMYYEEQNSFLNGTLKRRETKKSSGHSRKDNPAVSVNGKRIGRPRAEENCFTFEYFLRNETGIDTKVCQKAFCAAFGFGPKRLIVLRRKSATSISIEPDKRGKHDKHPTVGEEVKKLIREHIRSFPARHSHYSRRDNAGRVYLSPELSIARLYRLFLQSHDPEYIQLLEENKRRKMSHEPLQKIRKPLVSEHFYHDIFVGEFNIHFGYPRTDTCYYAL